MWCAMSSSEQQSLVWRWRRTAGRQQRFQRTRTHTTQANAKHVATASLLARWGFDRADGRSNGAEAGERTERQIVIIQQGAGRGGSRSARSGLGGCAMLLAVAPSPRAQAPSDDGGCSVCVCACVSVYLQLRGL